MQTITQLNTSKTTLVSDCMTYSRTPVIPLLMEKQSVIVEYLLKSSPMTCIAKSPICNPCIRTQKFLPTLVQVSITKEKEFKPYWTESCKEISSRLWLPTKTALLGLDSNSSNTLLTSAVEKSWFSTTIQQTLTQNSQRIFSQFCMFSHAECTDLGSTIIKSKKIYLQPTRKQKKIFNTWGGASRFVYNRTIDKINEITKEGGKLPKKQELFDMVKESLPDFCDNVPYQILKQASHEALASFFQNAKAVKQGRIKHFELQYKTKKDPKTSMYILKEAISNKGIYYTKTGTLKFKEEIPSNYCDSRLVIMYDDYYLCVPHKSQQTISENQAPLDRAVAVDLGLRSFATFYSEDAVGKIGENSQDRIIKICQRIDELISAKTKANAERKRKLQQKILNLKAKLYHLIDELHKKTARFLLDNFDIIILPTYNVSNMVETSGRKITKKSVRSMLSFKFYQFRQYMRMKCKLEGKVLLENGEEYTSMTASWSGEMNYQLGGSKVIKSEGLEMDRDYNGARGIFIKTFKELSESRQ